MNEDEENIFNLLQNLNNPQNENFKQADKIITELIMEQDQNFLQGIINILLNFSLEANESFYALSILKEYFRRSIIFDKFHDSFPRSAYSDDEIQLFQTAAYHFFTCKESFIRYNAADLYIQAFRTNMSQELMLIPQMIEKLTNTSTPIEEVLTIIECFCLILSELQISDTEEELFPILLVLLTQYSDNDEFNSLFFKLLFNFSDPIFHLMQDKGDLINFIDMTIKFYQEKVPLKINIINFLQSPCLEEEVYNTLVEKILPLIYNDLVNVESLPSEIGLSILNFINSDLMNKYPDMIEIFLSQFLTVILDISQLFNLDDIPEVYEWELFSAAQNIIGTLLKSPEKEVSTIIFESISPFIVEGLLSDDIYYQSASMYFLSYSMDSIDPGLINQSVSFEIINESLIQTIESQSCRVRFYAYQLLNISYSFYGLDIAAQFLDNLFRSVFDCEPIAINAIQTLIHIGSDKKFTLLDPYFTSIQEILSIDQIINNNTILAEFIKLLKFPKVHQEYIEPVIQFILSLLEQSLAIPDELVSSVDRKILHFLCLTFVELISRHYSKISEEDIKNIINLSLSLYNRFAIGTELYIIMYFIIKNPMMFSGQIKFFIELIENSLPNAEEIYNFSLFISFALFLDITFDLSQYEVCFISDFIELFNETQAFAIKKEIVSALFQTAKEKISLFTNEVILSSIDFLNDLSENVQSIFPLFLDESFDFYHNICRLFNKLIVLSAFNEIPQSFSIVNKLIVNILDFDLLTESIFDSLKDLFISFYNVYEAQLNELTQEQEVYMERYMILIQKLKESQIESEVESE